MCIKSFLFRIVSSKKSNYLYYKRIFEKAREYLLSFEEINKNMIEKHLNHWKEKQKANSLNDLLVAILESAQNKQGMPNTIGDIKNLRPYLEDFAPLRIIEKYDNNWEKLFRTIENNYIPPGRMVINNPQSFWVIFCKSAISASTFLSHFSNVKEFNRCISQFYLNEYTRLALPLLLKEEIDGFGFALACDFLKENGYPEFIKPDVHIKAIFNGIGISRSDSDYEIFKDAIKFSKSIGEIPYVVDKLFWLVGSGYFYLNEVRINTNRNEFIEEVRKEIL